MRHRILFVICFICFASLNCFGQGKTVVTSSAEPAYKGLTPGKSTKAAVGQVLGQPVRNVSETLIEYKFTEADGRAFVQYRDNSAAAIVERIELTCEAKEYNDKCSNAMNALANEYVGGHDRERLWPDASVQPSGYAGKSVLYYGAPRFIVFTSIPQTWSLHDQRFAFYSRELYESAAPKGCTGSIFGEWETNRGRMIIQRVGALGFKGTYSNGNGSFSGRYDPNAAIKYGIQRNDASGVRLITVSYREPQQRPGGMFVGEWKDDTGSGTMGIPFELRSQTFRGTWTRTSGSGPSQGTWEGRCVGSKQ